MQIFSSFLSQVKEKRSFEPLQSESGIVTHLFTPRNAFSLTDSASYSLILISNFILISSTSGRRDSTAPRQLWNWDVSPIHNTVRQQRENSDPFSTVCWCSHRNRVPNTFRKSSDSKQGRSSQQRFKTDWQPGLWDVAGIKPARACFLSSVPESALALWQGKTGR